MTRHTIPDHWTPVQTATWRTVHEYQRNGRQGAQVIAPLVGKSPGTLSNEVNPDVSTHKLGLDDAVALQHAADDYRILHAMAATLHHACLPLPDYADSSNVDLLMAFSEWQSRMGVTCKAIRAALEDGNITSSEARAIRTFGHDHMRAFLEFLDRIDALVVEDDMGKLDVEIPEFLRKRGIREVSDNVPDGYQVKAPVGRFGVLFGQEVFDILTRKPTAPDEGSSDESAPGAE
jgi:hypothetical protein